MSDETRNPKLETRFLSSGHDFSESRSLGTEIPSPPRRAEGSRAANHAARSASAASSGHGFSRAEQDVARSASTEGVWGKPLRVSPRSSLENAWIEIFRAGDYGDRGAWTPAHLDQLAATYDPRLHAAPVVLGHPADDAPAYGWVRRLRRAGASLWAQLEKVDPALEALLRAGRFAPRSVSLYTRFPATRGPYLRHLGFLGAAAPAVKGLAPVRFAEAPSVVFSFDESRATSHESRPPEAPMPESKSTLDSFLDHLRAFFSAAPAPPLSVIPGEIEESRSENDAVSGVPSPGLPGQGLSPDKKDVARSRSEAEIPRFSRDVSSSEGSQGNPFRVPPPATEAAFTERLAQLEQRLDALATAKRAAEEKLSASQTARVESDIANFVETLRSRGRFPPAFDRWGVCEFMARLAQVDAAPTVHSYASSASSASSASLEAKEAEGAKAAEEKATDPPLLSWFQDFLTRLPAVIEFGELTSGTSHEPRVTSHGRTIRFTEPARGMAVDPESVELAERAEALAAEAGISYAEALAQLREEHRSHPTTA